MDKTTNAPEGERCNKEHDKDTHFDTQYQKYLFFLPPKNTNNTNK
jgi:hypothetical protein